MAKIAVLIADMFEDSEYTGPAKAFMNAGHVLSHLGLVAGTTVKGKKEGTEVQIDQAIEDVHYEDFDALLIPGGYSPDKLRADMAAVEFVRDFANSHKPVFAICHGPQLLVSADVLKGKRVTGWKSIVKDIENAGAVFIDAEVVEDENFVSSRNPADIPAFIRASLSKLK